MGLVHVPLVVKTSLVEPGGIVPQLATVPLVVKYLPLLPVCDGSVPSKVMVLLTIVPILIQAVFVALRFLQTGDVDAGSTSVPVSIQSIYATDGGCPTVLGSGCTLPLLQENSAAKLLLMSARTVGNVSFWTVWSACAIRRFPCRSQ